MEERHFDALVVGAGLGGIYQLYRLRQLGLSVKAIDIAHDVGGTWYWNRYPGAMSDTESYIYRFSWDKEDLQTYPWDRHYLKRPEILRYIEHVVKRHDLRKNMQFNTEMTSATWDNTNSVWRVETTSNGNPETFVVRYLVTALGLLTKRLYPDIANIDGFKGKIYHTASWPEDVDLSNKDVGIIGNGSTGVQVMTEIAGKVKSLTSFQRNPQYSVPSGDGPVSPEYRKDVNRRYDEIMAQIRDSNVGFGFVESTRPFESFTPEEREEIFEQLWKEGNGFKFMFKGFSDVVINRVANEATCDFIRKKISQIVKDPEKARKLMPTEIYGRRPLCDGGYYEQFNRDNVDIVDVKETPIVKFTEKGMLTADGKEHKFDIVVLATGFDAVEGVYNRLHIRGSDGRTLKDHWKDAPSTYLGCSVSYFPNLLIIAGPQSVFANFPPVIELYVEFLTTLIERAERNKREGGEGAIEATVQGEKDWKQLCERYSEGSLFKETASWIFGHNIKGKSNTTRFFFGGLKEFRELVSKIVANGYTGFKPLTPPANASTASDLAKL